MLTGLIGFLILVVLLALVLWGADRHLCLKDVEKDLKLYLGDRLVVRDSSEPPLRVHFTAEISSLKALIRKHFSL